VQAGKLETEKLLKEYTALAPSYDRYWSTYLHASLSMTAELVADLPTDRILDIACGTGQLLEMLLEHPDDPELFGIDRVPAMLEVAKQRIGQRAKLLEASADELPFDQAAFQLVTCTNALHYFPDAAGALREMRRVLAPSGNLVITDWCRDYATMKLLNRILPWTRHAHVHTFSLGELEQNLARCGLRMIGSSRKKIDWLWGMMTVHAVPVPQKGSVFT
jgi:ubiquinone/menaquinone biosynthesis C-methylase UbiE